MCLICLDFQKQKMTLADARRAFGEMVTTMEPEHAEKVERMLADAARQPTPQTPAPGNPPSKP